MKRIVIVGTTSSGKSTLGTWLANQLAIPFIELDSLYWESNWTTASLETFTARVEAAIQAETWVAAGNYSTVRDRIWARADTVIWLDYPLVMILWRLLRRTLKRIITREDLWSTGNTESFRKQFMSRDSLFLWALESYPRRKRDYPMLLAHPDYNHLRIIHLRSPYETWLWQRQVQSV